MSQTKNLVIEQMNKTNELENLISFLENMGLMTDIIESDFFSIELSNYSKLVFGINTPIDIQITAKVEFGDVYISMESVSDSRLNFKDMVFEDSDAAIKFLIDELKLVLKYV